MKKYVDVIVPLPIANTFTYSLPESFEDQVEMGCRVVVPFGVKKYYTAIVVKIHYSAPEEYETKDISEVLDRTPVMLERQLAFWKWVAEYYLCTLGDVYKAALPSGMKLESETVVEYNPDFVADEPLSPKEQRILDILSVDTEQCITQIERAGNIKNILPAIKSLMEKDAIRVKEELKRNYKPKTEVRVRLQDNMRDEAILQKQFDLLARAPKQLALLMKYIELSGWMQEGKLLKEVSKKTLLDASGASASILNGLIDKHIFEIYNYEIGRLTAGKTETAPLNPLNEIQQRAFHSIMSSFHQKNICLIHGVTASGKTEVYIHLIEEVIKAGKQVLYLLPEIALTTQITERLKRIFGSRLGVYHSKFPDAERVEIWQKQLTENDYDVILGVRSSVFLPFRRLGLVIVDEEHETSYKQQDPAPRYHARSAAIMLASLYGAKTLLGTATPSMESYYNATNGKYSLVEMKERYQQIQLPEIEVVDIKELARKRRMSGHFSPFLLQKMREALENKEQIILFQNRRGFAPMIECRTCGWVPKCKNCDVSLTYHKGLNQLTCHYCGYTYSVPKSCPACGGVEIVNRGFGTEKVEDDIKQIFPDATVARMDMDTTRTRTAYERIINDFQEGRTDILIGTQMVSKGLDFDRVSVVGILNADSMLNYPDFRSYERAFQLMAQVSGRAGRKNKRGLVVLQTKSPDIPLIHQVVTNDYNALYDEQCAERSMFRYPPFYRLIYVYLKHRKEDVLEQAANCMASYLRNGLADRILGPDRPPVGRIQTLFIKKIVIKVEQQASMSKIRTYLQQVQRAIMEDERFKSLMVYYDVDPY
ncbi:primosomal protein N' [Bacteroides caecigallinarum]|uniref:replication restart helicase PriA n=1 Tax=Bacteroides caecigallinarum TaxID=1411144 RepID=UPI001F252C1F|nr:primosomal protein N' [Bacteroides caecigallinarum]MCF2594020.1 primosomal protein N' [Bacteroides caecigallinarum]